VTRGEPKTARGAGVTRENRAGPARTLRTLLAGLIDYAGLFPPASLSMVEAVRRFEDYQKGEMAWMLGHFVVPASRLKELTSERMHQDGSRQWRLSCIVGDDLQEDLQEIERFGDVSPAANAAIESIEAKGVVPERLDERLAALCSEFTVYVEVPMEVPTETLLSLRKKGARAKVRTGGLIPSAIPPTKSVAEFLDRCARADTQFKATAGLHHPLRSWRPLTYQPDSASAVMHGFLNLFLAAAFARQGSSVQEIQTVLDSEEAESFNFGEDEVKWRSRALTNAEIEKAREGFSISFGSCSFEEPIQDLRQLSLL
jgi:hypothetical protein